VEWRVGGTTSVDVDADLRRRRESMSATLWSSSARCSWCIYGTHGPYLSALETRAGIMKRYMNSPSLLLHLLLQSCRLVRFCRDSSTHYQTIQTTPVSHMKYYEKSAT